tara:strand:+ start:206 stop:943 length:738 start_codon:yes stop_codon:yes gene_type:complete
MPTNVYFDTGTKSEQHLYEDLMIEQLKIYGQDVFYIPRTLVKEDELFGEDTLSKFDDAYQIEMYFENVEGYEGEKEIMSKFGLQMNEDVTFVVARRRFEQLVSHDSNLIVKTRPNEGDLVYFPKVKKIFEISFVDHDDPFYQVHNVPAFKLKCKTFEYSGEDIDTGITEIDAIETANSLDQLVYQLSLEDGTGSLLTETGDYIIQEAFVVDTIDENAMNDFFDTQDDTIIDFTESNPFGDIGKVG